MRTLKGSARIYKERESNVNKQIDEQIARYEAEGLNYDHSATRRGYLRWSAGVRTERYWGNFGQGYIIAIPNCYRGSHDIRRRGSNNFYTIMYFTK